ncbi:MAG TPA: hypothetical protein VJ771_09130 [Candidatus Nitrosotalea sp.]|nr:hypothetical protein [Candidatus Nitrosotalea sp.]
MSSKLPLSMKFYGVSPWELEVLYSLLHSLFQVEEDKREQPDDDFTTLIDIVFPLAFNDAFFKWFGRARWDKIKAIFKEFKRRRGEGKTLRVYLKFVGKPSIKFALDLGERNLFDSAIDKIDFVLELLPYHLDPQKIPKNISEVTYYFDDRTQRWNIDYNLPENGI